MHNNDLNMTRPELDVRPKPARIPAHPSITRAQIAELVDTFYTEVRAHPRLGPLFEDRIGGDWEPHLDKMKLFWASVLLRTGDYKGKPVPAHMQLSDVQSEDFRAWLDTFRPVAESIFEPAAAEIAIATANRIAQSLWLAMFGTIHNAPPQWMR